LIDTLRFDKVGDKVILEKPPYDPKAFWAKIDALGRRDFPQVDGDDLRPASDDAAVFD
jgi:antitoxin VapB